MYTATITGKSIQRAAKRVVVDVEFTNGTDSFTESFSFGLQVTSDELKRAIKTFADRLEAIQANIEQVAPLGVVDTSTVVDVVSTAAELAKSEWFRGFGRLEQVQRLIELGVLTGAEQPVVNLRNKVKTDFRATYVADM